MFVSSQLAGLLGSQKSVPAARRLTAKLIPSANKSHHRQEPRAEIRNQQRAHGQSGPEALQPGPIVTPIVAERSSCSLHSPASAGTVSRNSSLGWLLQKFREHGVVVADVFQNVGQQEQPGLAS